MASKKLKKVLKAALIGGAGLLAAKGLGKRRLSKAVSGTDDAGIGVSHFKDYITKPKKWNLGGVDPGPTLAAKGGRIGAKHGGHVKSMGIAKRGGGVAKK
mgnify:CR=1 FL=1